MALRYGTGSVESNRNKGSAIYESAETLSAPADGDTILLPDESGRMDSVMVSLVVTAGGGKVQYTISNRADVIAGNAVWYDWDAGAVVANTTDVMYHVSAVRQVNTSGTTKLEVRWI